MIRRGVPENSLNIMMASLAKNTINQYSSSLNYWWQFCDRNSVDFYEGNSTEIITFLTEIFENGASYSTTLADRLYLYY